LALEGPGATPEQRQAQLALATEKRGQLDQALKAEAVAVQAAEDAAFKFIAAQKLADEAGIAGKTLASDKTQKELWNDRKNAALTKVSQLRTTVNEVVQPEKPDEDAVSVSAMENPRDRYLFYISGGCVALGALTLFMTRTPPALPALPAPPPRRPRRRRGEFSATPGGTEHADASDSAAGLSMLGPMSDEGHDGPEALPA
jgi:hypothetical protein